MAQKGGGAPIETQGLTKRFGSLTALDDLSITVAPGEVYGFLGPNGAGKTTTIRAVLGLARPTAGTARVFGFDAWAEREEAHRRLAFVPGEFSPWPTLRGGEMLASLWLTAWRTAPEDTFLIKQLQLRNGIAVPGGK